MYHDEKKNAAVGGSVSTGHQRVAMETGYQKRAEGLLTDENCYKIQMVSTHRLNIIWLAFYRKYCARFESFEFLCSLKMNAS